MESHGKYKIELIGNIVHIYPSGGFNEQGVKQINDNIILIAPRYTAWALLVHPDDSAGLTPEAVNEIVKFFQQLNTVNCVAVALEITSTWQGVLEKSLVGNVSIPVFMDSDLAKLLPLIEEKFSSV